MVSFSCPVGHLFSTGVKEMVSSCRPGGSWDNDYIPACVEAYCGPVPQIDNGFAVIASNVTWRGEAQFQVWLPAPCSLLPAPVLTISLQCYYGFAFPSGNQLESISCLEDGSWSPLPNCQGENSTRCGGDTRCHPGNWRWSGRAQ